MKIKVSKLFTSYCLILFCLLSNNLYLKGNLVHKLNECKSEDEMLIKIINRGPGDDINDQGDFLNIEDGEIVPYFQISALHVAVLKHYMVLARNLLRIGARLNIQDNMGDTPIHLACNKRAINFIEVFLNQFNDNLDLKNNQNMTISDLIDRNFEEGEKIPLNYCLELARQRINEKYHDDQIKRYNIIIIDTPQRNGRKCDWVVQAKSKEPVPLKPSPKVHNTGISNTTSFNLTHDGLKDRPHSTRNIVAPQPLYQKSFRVTPNGKLAESKPNAYSYPKESVVHPKNSKVELNFRYHPYIPKQDEQRA